MSGLGGRGFESRLFADPLLGRMKGAAVCSARRLAFLDGIFMLGAGGGMSGFGTRGARPVGRLGGDFPPPVCLAGEGERRRPGDLPPRGDGEGERLRSCTPTKPV